MENYFKHQFVATRHDSLALSVYNCGFQQCDSLFSWGPALRNHHLIHFVAKGSGKYVCNGRSYTVNAGSGFYAPPNEMIFYQADNDDPWEYYWVGFSGVDAGRMLKSSGLTKDSPCFSCDDPDTVKGLIMNIYNANGSTIENEAQMTGYLYLFFSHLVNKNKAGEEKISRSTEYVAAAIRFIEHNYAIPIGVNDIAQGVALSRSHLYRIFVQELGLTPNEYLTRFRINNARMLLRSKNISISEAAFSSGFSDPLYFSRVFKSVTGESPSTYLKRVNDEV